MINQDECTHGIKFDEEEADKVLGDWTPKSELEFVIGNPRSQEVRRRWPRGVFSDEYPCPFCGFRGIYYASCAHYVAGDW